MKKNIHKENLDDFFKSRLISPEISEVDEDWNRMKVILQKDRSNKALKSTLMTLSAIAAILIIVFLLIPDQQLLPRIDKTQAKKDVEQKSSSTDNLDQPKTPTDHPEKYETNNIPIAKIPVQVYKQLNTHQLSDSSKYAERSISNSPLHEPAIKQIEQPFLTDTVISPVVIASNNDDAAAESNSNKSVSVIIPSEPREIETETELPVKRTLGSRISVALLISQDFSGVNNLNDSRIGYGIGAGLIYKVTNKISAEGVIAYGKKIYRTPFSNYKPNSKYVFPVSPSEVNANCDVLDLQLNLNYTLLDNEKFSFGLGAGISSYLMLEEYYGFQYENSSSRGPRRYVLENENKHYLGIANLSVHYQRKLANNINLIFNPYLKLPLTDIGYGNVRLKSAGINVGIITNLMNQKK